MDPCYIQLGTCWRCAITFTLRPLSPSMRKESLALFLSEIECDPRSSLESMHKRKFLTPAGLKLLPLCHSACSQSLYRLSYCQNESVLQPRRSNHGIRMLSCMHTRTIRNGVKASDLKVYVTKLLCSTKHSLLLMLCLVGEYSYKS
jgi:hypothetical protein